MTINLLVDIALYAMLIIILVFIVIFVAALFAGMAFAAIDWCKDKIDEHRKRKRGE